MKTTGRRKSTNVEDRRGSNIEVSDGLSPEIVKTSYDNRVRRAEANIPKPRAKPDSTPKPKPNPKRSLPPIKGEKLEMAKRRTPGRKSSGGGW